MIENIRKSLKASLQELMTASTNQRTESRLSRAEIDDQLQDSLLEQADTIVALMSHLNKLNMRDTQIIKDEYEALWLSLEHQYYSPSALKRAVQSSSPASLSDLSYLLAEQLRTLAPSELQMQGLTMKTQDNRLHFCISGCFPLDKLQTVVESLRELQADHSQK